MSTSIPDPFVERGPWSIIGFGGVPLTKVALTKINGVSVKHKWTEQRSKETSGSSNTFGGTSWSHPKLTLEATESADFAEIRALYERMKPVPGQGGTGTTGTPAPQLGIGSPAGPGGASAAPAGGTSTPFTTPAPGTKPAKDASSSSTPNPGPRPPTISVQHPQLAAVEIFACALEEWVELGLNATNGYEVEITIIPDKPPTPAGAGTMAPAKDGAQFAIGSAAGPGGAGGDPVQKGAAAGAGGT